MIVDVCFATTQNGVEFFAPRGDVDEVFADLVVFGGLLMRRDGGRYGSESHRNELHGALLDLDGFGLADSLHFNEFLHGSHCDLG